MKQTSSNCYNINNIKRVRVKFDTYIYVMPKKSLLNLLFMDIY